MAKSLDSFSCLKYSIASPFPIMISKFKLLTIATSLTLTACAPSNPLEPEAGNIKLPNESLPAEATPGAIRQIRDLLMPPTTGPTAPRTAPSPSALPQRADYPQKITQTSKTFNLQTEKGAITIKTLPDKAPNTVENFVNKVNSGFYTGLTFHRVEDWLIQGGDPKRDGSGGGTIPTETNDLPFQPGSVGMARGADQKVSNDAQFFICIADCSWLAQQYTQFAQVTQGLEIAQEIKVGDTIKSISVVTESP